MSERSVHDSLKVELSKRSAEAAKAVARAERVADADDIRFDRALLQLGFLQESDLLRVISEYTGTPFIEDISNLSLDRSLLEEFGQEYLQRCAVIPLRATDDVLDVIVSDELDDGLIKELSFHSDRDVKVAVATTQAIKRALGSFDISDDDGISNEQTRRDRERLRKSDTEGPIINYVNDMLAEAVSAGASDVHLTNDVDGLLLRFRCHGILVEQQSPSHDGALIFARIKVMAGMNVAERTLPQDGRIATIMHGRVVDFRISAIPTATGESIVCRVLDPNALRLGWEKLGFADDIMEKFSELLERPNGLVLVTGPTGSGKTTTLYTALSELRTGKNKIVTIEDPIEYQLSGIEQFQVREDADLSFATIFRAVLRHDPNVVMVGEIRDGETADIACRAALAGRLVLSTLHTNNPRAASIRLADLGVDRTIVSEVLLGALGQDLQAIACEHCNGAGCKKCGEIGSVGRRLICDLYLPDKAKDD